MNFMEIVKQTNLNPLQLKSIKILNMWWKIFPEQKPWFVLKCLSHERIAVPHSQNGYCAWRRFSQGSLLKATKNVSPHPKKLLKFMRSKRFLKLLLK